MYNIPLAHLMHFKIKDTVSSIPKLLKLTFNFLYLIHYFFNKLIQILVSVILFPYLTHSFQFRFMKFNVPLTRFSFLL